jgi:tetratricopeptide (TPR) repeat protein
MVNENPFIRKPQPFLSYFSQEDGTIAHHEGGEYHSGYYRPLVNLTYFLDYTLWGMHAPGFRITNLILHLLTCLLLSMIVWRYYGGVALPLIAALLFGIHPVHTEAVSWTTARNNILVTLFSLASLYYYTSPRLGKRFLTSFLSLVFFTLAILSKEFAVMLLPIFFLYNRLAAKRSITGTRDEWIGYIPYIAILILYFTMRWVVTQSVLSPGGLGNIWQRLYFAPYLIIYNLKLVFFPYGLHSFSVGYPESPFTWHAAVGFGGVALIGLFLWKYREKGMIPFSLLSFVAGLFPVLHVVKTSAVSLISMRWLYFPMVFLVLGLSTYIQKFMERKQLLPLSIIGAVILYCGTYTYLLNIKLWHSEERFFRQEVMNFNNIYYAGGLAGNLLDNKQYGEAEHYFKIAIDHYPDKARHYISYSALLLETSRPYAALSILDKARSLTMSYRERGEWFNNMGMAYFQLNDLGTALEHFLKAVDLCPNEAQFWANLGGAYGSTGDYENSLSALKKGLNIASDSIQLKKNLAVTYMNIGEYKEAISILEEIPDRERREHKDIQDLLRKARKRSLRTGHDCPSGTR